MKQFLAFILVLFLCSCAEESNTVAFDSLQRSGEICPKCPRISVDIPVAIGEGKLSNTINSALEEELIYILNYDDDSQVTTAKEAMQSFDRKYKMLNEEFGEAVKWEADINGEVVYENASVVSLAIKSYLFTGGAHGYSSLSLLNFDKLKGEELYADTLFDDLEGFTTVAENHFRKQEQVPLKANINATGFMFAGDEFHLPENIGISTQGIYLQYNQYEVASYADGPIELIIPFEEANPYLKEKFQVVL